MQSQKNNVRIAWVAFLGTVAMLMVTGFYYVYNSCRMIPVMDFWAYFAELVEKTMTGTLKVSDLFQSSIGQRNMFLKGLVALDIRFLKGNILWQCYAGMIAIAITCCIAYYSYSSGRELKKKLDAVWNVLSFLPILFLFFSLNKWEILSLSFSFAFCVRILLYVLSFAFLNHLLVHDINDPKRWIGLGVFEAFTILTVSQLYFVSLVISALFVVCFDTLINKRANTKRVKNCLQYIIPCIVASLIYFSGGMVQESGATQNIVSRFFSENYLLSIMYGLVGSIFHESYANTWAVSKVVLVGSGLFLLIAIAAFLYFHKKVYEHSYMPLMCAVYGIVSLMIICFGRTSFGPSYMLSSRYVVETQLVWIGVVWTLLYCIHDKRTAIKGIAGVCILFILGMTLFTSSIEMKIAPYRGLYKDECRELAYSEDIDSLPEEEFSVFQSSKSTVLKAIKLMKKYELNIFSPEEQKKYEIDENSIGNSLEKAHWIYGYQSDGWIEESAEFMIRTTETGKMEFEIYYPFDEKVESRITIDGIEHAVALQQGINQCVFDAPSDKAVSVKIDNSGFAKVRNEEDVRRLSFILSNVICPSL